MAPQALKGKPALRGQGSVINCEQSFQLFAAGRNLTFAEDVNWGLNRNSGPAVMS